jgi:ACT domain-containing protein
MNELEMHYWVFRIQVQDCAGALTSVSSAFSNSVVNIDTIAAHGADENLGVDAAVTVIFVSDEEEKEVLLRKIKRLTKVNSIDVSKCNVKKLRKSIIRVAAKAT